MSIVTSLLRVNFKENLKTRFFANKTDLKDLFMFIDVTMAMAHTSAKLSKNLSLFCELRMEGFREIGEWNRYQKPCSGTLVEAMEHHGKAVCFRKIERQKDKKIEKLQTSQEQALIQ